MKKKKTRFLSKTVPCPVCDLPVKRERTLLHKAVHAVRVSCVTCGYHFSSMDLESIEGFLKTIKLTFVWNPAYEPGLNRLTYKLLNFNELRERILTEARNIWASAEGRTLCEMVQQYTLSHKGDPRAPNPGVITRYYDWLVLHAERFPIFANHVKSECSKEKPRGKDRAGDGREQGQKPVDRPRDEPNGSGSGSRQVDEGGAV